MNMQRVDSQQKEIYFYIFCDKFLRVRAFDVGFLMLGVEFLLTTLRGCV